MNEINDNDTEGNCDEQIESLKAGDEASEDFEVPAGIGNSVEMADNDSAKVQELRTEFRSDLAEFQSLREEREALTGDRMQEYLDTRQSPAEAAEQIGPFAIPVDAIEMYAEAQGTERNAFSEGDKERLSEIDQRMAELQQEMDMRREEIRQARRAQYGYPHGGG